MKLDFSQREQLRLSLLRFLDNNASTRGMGAALLMQMARNEGRPDLDAATVGAELQYLSDKDLIRTEAKTISPELRVWRITAEGRDFVAANM